jgi:hypothetical protein
MNNNSYNQAEFQFDSVGDNLILQDALIETSGDTKWSDTDIQILKEFCKKHRIPRFHCGHMSPVAALAYLKTQMGVVDGPTESKNTFNQNNPYQFIFQKKDILHG